jgi:hypothetical protein
MDNNFHNNEISILCYCFGGGGSRDIRTVNSGILSVIATD